MRERVKHPERCQIVARHPRRHDTSTRALFEEPAALQLLVRPANYTPDAPPERLGERRVRLDFETDGLEWWNGSKAIGASYYFAESGRRGYVSWGHKGGGNSCDEVTGLRWLQREIRDCHVDNSNTKFDIHISRASGADLTTQNCTFGDVAFYGALLDDHRFRFGVDQLAQDFLGPDRGKLQLPLKDKGRLHELPAWTVAPYAVEDVVLVHDLIETLRPLIADQDLSTVLQLEESIIPVVVEMEKNGAYLDVDTLFRWREEARNEYEELLHRIFRATGVRVTSVDSNLQIQAIFKARGIPITTFTDGGKTGKPKPSFTADVMQRAAEHDECVRDLMYAGQLADLESKYLGKYCETVRQSDGWIRYNLHQLRMGRDEDDKKGTVSGRFSSAGDEHGGFNVQQVVSPKKQKTKNWCTKYIIRNLFKPRNGKWLAVDASQIEYRIFAHFANDAEILNAYQPVPGVSDAQMREEKRGPYTDYHDRVQAMLERVKPDIQRKHTKITNFCKLFGSAEIKFCYTLELIGDQEFKRLSDKYDINKWRGKGQYSERQKQIREEPSLKAGIEIFDLYDNNFPAAKETLDLAKATAKDRKWVKTWLGRRARFPRGQRAHSALNRVVQGTAADINKRVLVEVFNRRQELGLTMRMTVHDEVDCDLADEGMLDRVVEVFNTQYIPLKVPILWDAEVGPSWGEAKAKA